MLAPALWWDVGDRAFDNLEQRLLHAFARNITGCRRIVALAADLVDLVDVDNAALSALHVVISILQQLNDDVLDVLTDVASFCQRRRISDREGHLEDFRKRLSEQGLAAARGTEQQNIALSQLYIVGRHPRVDALVVVVHRHTEYLFRPILPHDILVENRLDLVGSRNWVVAPMRLVFLDLFRDDVVAERNAFVADVHGRPSYELFDFLL